MNKDIKKIAIVRLSALGDIVNSAIVLQFIKKKYPHIIIEWITEEVFAPLLLNHPFIDKVHTIHLKKFKKEKKLSLFWQDIQKLSTLGEYDLVIDMQGLIKSSLVTRLVSKNTHGFDKNSIRESIASLLYKTSSHISYKSGIVSRNTFLVADALGFSISDEMILHKKPIFEVTTKFLHTNEKKHIAFVIGASWESKIYPKELIAKLCDTLGEQCHIIWGNEKEKESAQWIVQNSSYASLAPKLELSELSSFISSMDLLIGNDTGPTHMAWAQNVPSITLFGPTNKRMIYETPQNRAIESSSSVNILKINKEDYSIKNIPYQTIVNQAKELLYGL